VTEQENQFLEFWKADALIYAAMVKRRDSVGERSLTITEQRRKPEFDPKPEPKSRRTALTYEGKVCKYGHTLRMVSNDQCATCRRAQANAGTARRRGPTRRREEIPRRKSHAA